MNFSATPPLELAKLMMSMVATAQWDQTAWLGQEGHEQFRDRDDAHGHQQSELSVSMKKKKNVELPPEMWSKGCPEYGRLRVSLYGTRDAAANWEDAYAKVQREHQFDRVHVHCTHV